MVQQKEYTEQDLNNEEQIRQALMEVETTPTLVSDEVFEEDKIIEPEIKEPAEESIRDVCKRLGVGWTGDMDGYLRTNLDQARKIIKKDWDMVFVIDGYEGSGKSVLAQQCALYVDRSFDVTRCCFTPEEFISQINKAKKYQAVVYDEAYGGMSSRAALSEVNRGLMSVLAEIRQKNLFVFLVLPCWFELDKMAGVWRARALMHVYTGDNFERGRFGFYNQERKKLLYALGKKLYSYSRPRPNFIARFAKGYSVDEDAYREKKLAALRSRENKPKEETGMVKRMGARLAILLKLLKKEHKYSSKQLAELLGYEPASITDLIGKYVGTDTFKGALASVHSGDSSLESDENGGRE